MKTKAYLCIISGAALWGLIGLFVGILSAQGFTPMQVVALRSIASAVCITFVLLKLGLETFRIRFRDLWMFTGTGVLSLTFFNYCYFNCMQEGSLAVAALLLYTAPIFVMLMSLFLFGERFTAAKGAALAATFLGCACVTGVFSSELTLTFRGLLYGLSSGFGYALYSIFGKFALRRYSSPTITAYTFYCSTAASVPLAGFAANYSPAMLNLNTLGGMLGIGLLCAVIPYILYTKGLQYVDAGQASILATIEPFVAALVGVFCFGEPLTLPKICGMVLIFISIVILNIKSES